MGRDAYQSVMEQRLRDLSLQIDSVRSRLMGSPSDGLRQELAEQLAWPTAATWCRKS